MSIGDEYYTPPYIIDAARRVLGQIDIDPASNERANKVVRAARIFTLADDGLVQPWRGRLWCNPPFSTPKPFVDKLIAEYDAGHVSAGIILVNNGTETAWGQALLARFPVCFFGASSGHGSRISFWHESPENPEKGNRYAQMIAYAGSDTQTFCAVFSRLGQMMLPYHLHGTPCVICGHPFTAKRADTLYCSAACRQKAKRRRLTL